MSGSSRSDTTPPAFGDQLVDFLDQLIGRLHERGLIEFTITTGETASKTRLTEEGRAVAGQRPGTGAATDLQTCLVRLATAVELRVPHVP